MNEETKKDRSKGALMGAACGDALGTTLEFSRPLAAREAVFPTKMNGPLTDIVGGGPFSVAPGQVTDDTQMAAALAVSLFENKGYDPTDMARRYRMWRDNAFDCGGQTGGSISRLRDVPKGSEYLAGLRSWENGRRSAGNGSLMRCTPIGVFYADNAEERTRVSVLDSMMTHADPRCIVSCTAYNWSIAHAITTESPTVAQLLMAAEGGIEASVNYLRVNFPTAYTEDELENARYDAYEDLVLAQEDNPRLFGGGFGVPDIHDSSGFVRTAFRYAFWALAHASDYSEAIIDVVNRGGDADTNGAIVGGLLGAYFGASGIPWLWRTRVLSALQDRQDSIWWKVFHPRFMLALVEPALAEDTDWDRLEKTVQSWRAPYVPTSWAPTRMESKPLDAEALDSPFMFDGDEADLTPLPDDDGPLFPEFVKR